MIIILYVKIFVTYTVFAEFNGREIEAEGLLTNEKNTITNYNLMATVTVVDYKERLYVMDSSRNRSCCD